MIPKPTNFGVGTISDGPFARGIKTPWLYEPIAGMIDLGETPETCTARGRGRGGFEHFQPDPHFKIISQPRWINDVFPQFLGIVI